MVMQIQTLFEPSEAMEPGGEICINKVCWLMEPEFNFPKVKTVAGTQ